MSKKVSVIIPCFNATKWLPKCFLSLVQQTIGIENIELIFVDDASTDNGETWNMLQEFECAYPESILILKLEENMRQGGARNIALQYATGEYIAFVDSDDFVTSEFLQVVYKAAHEHNADFVQFEYCYYTENLGVVSSNRAISPGRLIPISKIASSVSGSNSNIIMATPIWLFQFPCVFTTRYFFSNTALIISLVVVFPTLPVTPITGISNRLR